MEELQGLKYVIATSSCQFTRLIKPQDVAMRKPVFNNVKMSSPFYSRPQVFQVLGNKGIQLDRDYVENS